MIVLTWTYPTGMYYSYDYDDEHDHDDDSNEKDAYAYDDDANKFVLVRRRSSTTTFNELFDLPTNCFQQVRTKWSIS